MSGSTTHLPPQKVPASTSEFMPPRVVTADSTPGFGRMKENKKCSAPSLRKDAKTAHEIAHFAFQPGVRLRLDFDQVATSTTIVSSSSSTSSAEHDRDKQRQQDLNHKILLQSGSRQGRESQRWSTKDNHRVRLVTGCVPILKGGRILFVSSRNKPEWILPKGGWEEDETMEESAIRETFEEAGVVGTLGPKLSPVQYETRKSKKRRQDMEDILKKNREAVEVSADESKDPVFKDVVPSDVEVSKVHAPISTTQCSPRLINHESAETKAETGAILSEAVVRAIPGPDLMKRSDETASITSDSSVGNYAYVKLTMIPLYVTEIREDWPESGRFRMVVHIDEAIELMNSREEFRAALIEVKERKLHLVPETPIVQEDHP